MSKKELAIKEFISAILRPFVYGASIYFFWNAYIQDFWTDAPLYTYWQSVGLHMFTSTLRSLISGGYISEYILLKRRELTNKMEG